MINVGNVDQEEDEKVFAGMHISRTLDETSQK